MKPVLVIEDDEDTSTALLELMHLERIPAIGVRNGAAAIDRFHKGMRPCVIVLDLTLPVMDGDQFLKARRVAPDLAKVPVLLITGRDVKAEDYDGMNVAAVFRKPFDPSQIVEAVRRYSDRHPENPSATR